METQKNTQTSGANKQKSFTNKHITSHPTNIERMEATIKEAYDDVPYVSNPFSHSSPSTLSAVASLFGLAHVDIANCKVLELGCAAGGNLIPLAISNPNSSYVGIDLSSVQIEHGQKNIAAMGLSNITLHEMSITNVTKDFGQFDYIICHGVYSWVPRDVQEAILRICSENLTPNGIAYVSYNTYPGWKFKEVMRDAMILRGAAHKDSKKGIAYAKGMLEFMQLHSAQGSLLRHALDENIPQIQHCEDYYLVHEYLEPFNDPCYFQDFIDRADKQELCYLAEADPACMFLSNYEQGMVKDLLNECGNNQVHIEQYLDFISNRQFRQTLLTHKNRKEQISYNITAEKIGQLHYAGHYVQANNQQLIAEIDLKNNDALQIKCHNDLHLFATTSLEKAVLLELSTEYPNTLQWKELVNRVYNRLGHETSEPETLDSAHQIMTFMLGLITTGKVCYRVQSLCTQGFNSQTVVAGRPMLSDFVYTQLKVSHLEFVTNIWHHRVNLDLVSTHLLYAIDGKRTIDELNAYVMQKHQEKIIVFNRTLENGLQEVITDEEEIKASIAKHVNNSISILKHHGLIVV